MGKGGTQWTTGSYLTLGQAGVGEAKVGGWGPGRGAVLAIVVEEGECATREQQNESSNDACDHAGRGGRGTTTTRSDIVGFIAARYQGLAGAVLHCWWRVLPVEILLGNLHV